MNKKIILVSLIHNRRDLVGLAVQSAVNQTLDKSKWTHLLFDNASADGADKVAEVFAKKYNHIELVRHPENLGQQKAFNFILNEWLPKHMPDAVLWANLDSDDELMPDALEEVEKMFDAHPEIGQIYSGFDIIGPAPRSKIKHKNHAKAKMVPNQFTPEGQKVLRKMFVKANPIGHMRAFRISCLREIGGFNTHYQYSTDYNAAGRMLEKFPVVKINKVLYRWRQHSTQVERQHSPQQTRDWQNMQKEFREKWSKMGLI